MTDLSESEKLLNQQSWRVQVKELLHPEAWATAASLPDPVEEDVLESPSWIAMQEEFAEREAEEARIDEVDRLRKKTMVRELRERQERHQQDKKREQELQEHARLRVATPRQEVELVQTVFIDVVSEKTECAFYLAQFAEPVPVNQKRKRD